MPDQRSVISMTRTVLTFCVAVFIASFGQLNSSTMPLVKLYAMHCGQLVSDDLDALSDEGVLKGQSGRLVSPCFLIRHPKGDLIVDAGLGDHLAEADGNLQSTTTQVTVERKLIDQLSAIGLEPSDVEFLVLTHAHYDHTGNANMFAGAEWLVDPRERKWMFDDAASKTGFLNQASYSELRSSSWRPVERDFDVFGDGTVVLLQTPGHTPGHLSVLLRLRSAGPVMLTGDLYHLERSRVDKLVPVVNTDRQETLRSITKFETIAADEEARVIINHSPGDFSSLPAFPAYLD